MKRIALLAVIGAGLMALPGTAAAQEGTTNCPGGVGASPGQICVNVNMAGSHLGGELVINNSDGCSYINGWSDNPGQGAGYAGLCLLAGPAASCTGGNTGSGANEGGCFVIRPPVGSPIIVPSNAVTNMFICGNTSGEDPQNSNRDGCFVP